MTLFLSVLDQSPIYEGETAEDAFRHTVAFAQAADQLGYRRFWVSEHHDLTRLAGSSPEVLISHLLAKTERIRVGSGGVMLQHYSPYKVAENFNVLAALAPGRVDLGIGRAPGGLPNSTTALQADVSHARPLEEKLKELTKLLHPSDQEDSAQSAARAQPTPGQPADVFLLGTSEASAVLAAQSGLPYVFAHFINGNEEAALEAVQIYREQFVPSESSSSPQVLLAVSIIVADSEEEAASYAWEFKQVKVTLGSGRSVNLSSVEQAEEYGKQAGEPYTLTVKDATIIKGTKETVRDQLLDLQERFGLDEIIAVTLVKDFVKRLRSLSLLHEAFTEAAVRP